MQDRGNVIEKKTHPVGGNDVEVIMIWIGAGRAVLTNMGARLLELHVPDRRGNLGDVVLQRPGLQELRGDDTDMGSTAGRCANRIRCGELRRRHGDFQPHLTRRFTVLPRPLHAG